ncbi:MAG: hypothetical protein ACR5K4_00985 [Sodalis sp. (in: enterobacteria)]
MYIGAAVMNQPLQLVVQTSATFSQVHHYFFGALPASVAISQTTGVHS